MSFAGSSSGTAAGPGAQQLALTFKYIVVGDTEVGKTCLLLRYTDDKFDPATEITIGAEYGTKTLTLSGQQQAKLDIWDTAGQENFRSLTRGYFRGACAAVLVFDVTHRQSFEHIQNWVAEVRQHEVTACPITMVLVGNKTDLSTKRRVSTDEASEYVRATPGIVKYIEASAKSGAGVSEIFTVSAEAVWGKVQQGDIEYAFVSGRPKAGTRKLDQPADTGGGGGGCPC